ncbi:hypothetical protein BC938DRAFT_481895 [Jimgerdemannia flammicorona]|uniref:Sec1-like protein n=1 Tax=Jimgerdemannia flammicorona TaxID=994334 RepID=A0A433QF64_9FUNG|nr:hypothetical protein BC938DRAFT_481895 [Jimgerdemannia flammicorona]
MVSIVDVLKKRLLDMIRSIQPPGRWKIVVVDSKSVKTLSAACKMYDILEENVTLVENIEKTRQPYPNLEAIYFLTPCQESINRLVDDFARRQGPMYGAAHVHFTSEWLVWVQFDFVWGRSQLVLFNILIRMASLSQPTLSQHSTTGSSTSSTASSSPAALPSTLRA